MRSLPLALASLTLAVAAPAAAADNSVAFSDPCGDASEAIAYSGAAAVPLSTERTARHDLASITATAASDGGVDLTVRVCGPIPAPGYATSNWTVAADVGGDCRVLVDLIDARANDPVNGSRKATLRRHCTTRRNDPVISTVWGPVSETREVYSAGLAAGAWSVNGDTIRWHVTGAELTAAGVLARTWTGLNATTFDGQRGTETSVGDTGANGPGVRDAAATAASLTLG